MTDRIDMSEHDVPLIEVFDEDPTLNPEADRKILLGDYEPNKFKREMGVDEKQLISPKKPEPQIVEGSLFDCLTHNGVFSPEDCRRVIATNTPEVWEEAGMNKKISQDEKLVNHKWRHTHNSWIEKREENLWLFDKMLALVLSANQRFGFEIDFFEALQLAKYDEGMHYEWHADLGPGHMGNRKLSVTVQLSSPDAYEGGDLLIDTQSGTDFVAPRELGSVTVFPSFMKHKVTPVTKGTRYSLVVWASGTQRFR